MKKLAQAIDRFCTLHPRFGIPNLMRYVVLGNIAFYLLSIFSQGTINYFYEFFSFSLNGLLHGRVWQIVTFLFVPIGGGLFTLLISCYFYYWIGSTLESYWGTAKFSVYYISGAVLTLLGVVAASLISGNNMYLAGAEYVNLAMFFAFAMLNPDAQVLLFFFIPIRIKWLAWVDAALFAADILMALSAGDWVGVVPPVMALLNFFVFFAPQISGSAERARYQRSRQAENYRRVMHERQQQAQQQSQQRPQSHASDAPYRHKCAVCGRTDVSNPELQFRYCSQCAGYHCFCSDHIFSHVHFTDEM